MLSMLLKECDKFDDDSVDQTHEGDDEHMDVSKHVDMIDVNINMGDEDVNDSDNEVI